MKSLGRRELLKTLATISGAAAVTSTARGRTLKPANVPPARCSANVLNVIIHGTFAITANDQNITLVAPRVEGHYYAAGSFGLERPLRLNGAELLSYTLSVPGWKPSRPVVSESTDIVVRDRGTFHFDKEAFCSITMPATSEVFRVSVMNRGKRRIFVGPAGVASEPDAIPMVYVFQYTYAGGLPSLGDVWTADPAGDGAHNLHVWAAPPFLADHAHTQDALDAFNNLFDPSLGLKLTDEQFDPPVTNIQCCGVSYPEVLSMPEARLQATARQSASSPLSMSPFRSNFLGTRSRTQVAPMFTGHVRTCFNIWVMQ